jgi:hypothetical protein
MRARQKKISITMTVRWVTRGDNESNVTTVSFISLNELCQFGESEKSVICNQKFEAFIQTYWNII